MVITSWDGHIDGADGKTGKTGGADHDELQTLERMGYDGSSQFLLLEGQLSHKLAFVFRWTIETLHFQNLNELLPPFRARCFANVKTSLNRNSRWPRSVLAYTGSWPASAARMTVYDTQ